MEIAGRSLFVALVTCYLLGRILGGAVAPAEIVVYGVTAAFGLEYLVVPGAASGSAAERPLGRAGPCGRFRVSWTRAVPTC